MASSLNASTAGGGGVIVTSDASGNLNIQSGGSTVVAVTSAGATVTGTLSATGASTFTGTGKFATTIGVGNATPAASGSGITFPASQSASSDANTLDDYEEGTWTPSIGGTATYNARWGTYTKVGNLVTVMFNVNILLINSGSTTTLSGLPFLINNPTYGNDQSGVLTYFEQIATSVYTLNCRGTNGASTLFFSGTTASAFAITNVVTVFKNGAILQGGITYQTTS